jgi:hypothetical protein
MFYNNAIHTDLILLQSKSVTPPYVERCDPPVVAQTLDISHGMESIIQHSHVQALGTCFTSH